MPEDVRELLRSNLEPCVRRLIVLSKNLKNPSIALAANTAIIERVLGKSVVPLVNINGGDDPEELAEVLRLLGVLTAETK